MRGTISKRDPCCRSSRTPACALEVVGGQGGRVLRDFKARKGLDALCDKYWKDDKEAFKQMGFPFYF